MSQRLSWEISPHSDANYDDAVTDMLALTAHLPEIELAPGEAVVREVSATTSPGATITVADRRA